MKCPHCLNSFHEQSGRKELISDSEYIWHAIYQTCPECQKAIILLQSRDTRYNQVINKTFLVYPKGITRSPLPPEVDDINVVNDYNEASLVLNDSPKASAALSRRCLQHILREKAQVKKADLSKEIQEVLDSNKLPSDIAEGLDAVRNIGNFAAHPIKSINTGEIVDVELQEAEWNLEVLELLIDFYYVRPAIAKKKRANLNAKLVEAGKPELQ